MKMSFVKIGCSLDSQISVLVSQISILDSQVAVVSRNGREVIKGGLELNDSAMVAELQEAIHKQIKSLICFRSFF
ncbi:hypothetical protein QYF36_002834 [Acer negundo]|nr:hypothetical protein QYF36_002834 [Acer negundo]